MTSIITPSSNANLTYDTVSLNGNLLTSFKSGTNSSITFNKDVTIYSYLVVSGGNAGSGGSTGQALYANYFNRSQGGGGGNVVIITPSTPLYIPSNTSVTITIGTGSTNGNFSGTASSIVSSNGAINTTSGPKPTWDKWNVTGGDGTLWTVNNTYYGGGGGSGGRINTGYPNSNGFAGGLGGGGAGGSPNINNFNGYPGAANTGGGGGGAARNGARYGADGAGGSGIVIIYYKINNSLNASNQDENGFTYTLNSSNPSNYTAAVSGVPANLQNVNILSYVVSNNIIYNVTSITDYLFGNYPSLLTISLPNSITSIGNYAFNGATNLTAFGIQSDNPSFASENDILFNKNKTILLRYPSGKIGNTYTIPTGVVTIANGAFTNARNLTTINLSNTVTISDYAFQNCSVLASISLPTSIRNVGVYAFIGCSALNNIAIQSSSITSVGTNAFAGLPASITVSGYIPASTFNGVTSLTNLIIGTNTTSIGTSAFQGCSSLTNIYIQSSSITSVGANAFASLPSSITVSGYIPASTFSGVTSLINVTIGSNTTNIGASAFSGCTNLVYMSLPGSITNAISTFLSTDVGSVALTINPANGIYTANGITYTLNSNGQATVSSYSGASASIPIYVTANNVKYPVTRIADSVFNGKSLTSVIIPPFITSIGNYAFYNNSLTAVNLPPGLTAVGTHCFENNLITSAYFPSNLTNISESIFQNNRLGSINISPSLTTIGNYAFAFNFITTINNSTNSGFPATSLTTIGQYAFKSNQLSNINIPTNSNFTSLSDGVFSDNLLQTVAIPSNITTIGIEVFRNNSITSFTWLSNVSIIPNSMFMENKFTSIIIPSQITAIGYAAFLNCNLVSSISFNSNLNRIDEAAFRNHQIQTINLPASLTFIGLYAFAEGKLSSIIIPSNVQVIDGAAFYNNQITSVTFSGNNITYLSSSVFEKNQLPSISIPSSVTSIQQFALNNNLLTSVTIPSSVTSIGQYAFANNQLTPLNAPSQTTITSIGYAAFYNNLSLTAVATTLVAGTTSTVADNSSGIRYSLLGTENNGQYGSENQYIAQVLNYTGTSTTVIIPFAIIYNNIKYNITSIANSAFSQKNLTSVTLNMNINSIGNLAFANNNLTSIPIPNSVTNLGDSAFYNNRLTSVNISTNVSSLNTSLFQLNRLTSITIPQTINSIGGNVFADNSLNSIIIPAAITAIPQHAFRNNRLTSIDLSNTLTNQIANNAFQNNAIAQLSIPSRITSIGISAFQNNRLSSITFAGISSITTFNDYVFADNSLNSITIPSNVTTIGNNALQNNLLTGIQLPANLVYIGQSAFQTNQLQSAINIPSSVNYVGNNAFATNLLSKSVEASATAVITFSGNNQTGITTLGDNIFNNNAGLDNTKKVYITYVYGKKWASTARTLSNQLVPSSLSFDSIANTIQIIIQKITVSPSVSIQNKVYDGTQTANGTYILIGAISNDNITVTANATFIDKNVGQNKVVNVNLLLSGDSSSNYLLSTTTAAAVASITPKTITPSITAINKFYDTTTYASFSYTLPGVISLDSNPTLIGSAVFSNSSVGQNKPVSITGLLLTGDNSSNYTLSSTTAASTATIVKKYVYFSIPNKIYDGSSTISKYDLSGVYASDASNITVSGLLTFSQVTVGSDISVNASNIDLSGSKSSNYDASYLGGVNNPPWNSSSSRLTGNIVQKALDFSSVFTKIYDGTVTYNKQIDLSGIAQSDIGLVDFSYTIVANYDISEITTNKITITNVYLKGNKSANYSINQIVDVSGRIFPKPLDISATIIKTYDKTANTNNNRIDLSGIISFDNGKVDVSYATATYNSVNTGNNQVTLTNVRLTGEKAQNYTINSTITVNGIINKKTLDVSASPISKVYDTNTTFNFIVDLSGILPGDNVSATGTGDASGANVTTYTSSNITTNYSRFALSGPQSGNYDISTNSIIQIKNSAIITRKFLTASANVIDKIYNGDVYTDVSFVLNGILSNDNVDVSTNYIAKYRNANVGQNKQIDVSNIALYGASSGNYNIDSSLLVYGNILQKPIDLSYIPITKVYNGSSDASNSVNMYLIGTMDTSTNVRFTSANFDSAYVGTNKQVNINGISIYGDTSFNYILPYTILTTNGSITAKNLAISINTGTTKIYDSNNNANLNISLTGKVQSDIVNVSYTSSLFDNSYVGQNKIITISGITLSGRDSNNYSIYTSSYVAGTITPYILSQSNVIGVVSTKLYITYKPTDLSANVQFYLNNILPSDQNNLYVIYSDAYFIQNTNLNTVYDNSNNLNVHIYGIDLSGIAKNNYNLNITTLDLSGRYINIPPTILDISLNTLSINKIYDGTTHIDVSLSLYDASNSKPANVAINYATSIFDNKNIGTNKPIQINGVYLTGTDSYKYITDSSLSTASFPLLKGSISKKRIDISRNVITKEYDGNQNLTNILLDISGVISGDSITCRGDCVFSSSTIGQKNVNVTNIRLIGDLSTNYDLSSTTIDLSGQINAKLLTVFASKIYDASNTVYQSDLSLSGIVQNQIVAINASGEYSQTTPGNITANLRNIVLTGDNSSNYTIPSSINNINASIFKRLLGITISKVYNGSSTIISTDVSLNGILHNENVYFSGTGNFIDASAANNIQVTSLNGSLLGDNKNNYIINTSGLSGTISPKPVNVSVYSIIYKQSNIAELNNFTITNSLVYNDRNNRVNLTKPSTVTLYYDSSQSGNRYILNASGNLFLSGDLSKNYFLDNTQTITAIINKKGIDLSTNSKVYDGSTNLSISNIVLKNIITGDDVSLTSTQLYMDISNVGNGYAYVRDASLIGISSNNYTISTASTNNIYRTPITVTRRPITVRVYPRTYDGTATVYTENLYLNNIIQGDNINVTATGSYNNIYVGTNKPVDLSNIQLTGTSRFNYSTSLTATASGEIYRRVVGLTILPRIYDGSSTVYLHDFSLNNIISIDKGKVNILGDGSYNSRNAGQRTVSLRNLSLYGAASSNYDISSTLQRTAEITPLTAILSIIPKTYDTTVNVDINYVYVKNKITNDEVIVSGNGSYDSSFVGNRQINFTNLILTGFDYANYYIPQSIVIDGSIIPHPLSIVVNDKEYDGDNKIQNLSLTNIYTNTIGIYPIDDNKVFINGFLLYSNNIAEMDKLVDISNNLKNVYLTGDCSINYYIYNNIFETGNILPKQITINPTAITKTYDTYTDANVLLEISGLVPIDNGKYFANYEFANYYNAIADNAKPIMIKYIYITGPYVQNYIYDTSATTIGDILRAPLTITAIPKSKIYDNTISTTAIYNLNGVFENDHVTVTGDASFNDKNAGNNKPVTMTNFILHGDSSPNYYIQEIDLVKNGIANVYPAKLIPSIGSISNKTYDGSLNTTGTIDLSGAFSNNVVSANGTFSFRTPDVSNNIRVDVSNIYLIGEDTSNYELLFNDLSGTSNIVPLQLNITPYTKTYDGTTSIDVSSIQLNGMIDDEIIGLGGSAVFNSPLVGNRTISINGAYLTGISTKNYTIQSQQTVAAEITKRILTIKVNNKVYDGSNGVAILDIYLNGIQNNDNVSVSNITATYANGGNVGNNIHINISNVVLSGNLSSQYDISGINDVYGNVIPKVLTASATAADKYYDGLTHADANVIITDGIKPGDNVYIVSFDANFYTPDIGDNKPVDISNIQLGGLSSNNYKVSPTTTTASILYNQYITAFNQVTYTKRGESYQTTTNTSGRMKYSMYTTRNS